MFILSFATPSEWCWVCFSVVLSVHPYRHAIASLSFVFLFFSFDAPHYPLSLSQRVLHSSARAEGRAKWDEENQARQAHEERVK